MHGVDIPQIKWPKAEFPRYKYPLEEHARENRSEDDRCLASVEDHIHNQTKVGCPVAGILVEPIQAEGGDHHGSKHFFQVSLVPFTFQLVKIDAFINFIMRKVCVWVCLFSIVGYRIILAEHPYPLGKGGKKGARGLSVQSKGCI